MDTFAEEARGRIAEFSQQNLVLLSLPLQEAAYVQCCQSRCVRTVIS
jgi:hypothetical protein